MNITLWHWVLLLSSGWFLGSALGRKNFGDTIVAAFAIVSALALSNPKFFGG